MTRPSTLRLAALILAATAALFQTACNTSESMGGKAIDTAPIIDVEKGSPEADLIASMGQPTRIDSYEKDPDRVKIWVYESERKETNMAPVRYEDIPHFDPLTGGEKIVKEPVYLPQTVTSKQILYVYVIDNKVFGWKLEQAQQSEVAE